MPSSHNLVNESAEELARKKSATSLSEPEHVCAIGKRFIAMMLRTEEERNRTAVRQDCLNLTKKSLRIIVRIITGDFRLNYFLGKLEMHPYMFWDSAPVTINF